MICHAPAQALAAPLRCTSWFTLLAALLIFGLLADGTAFGQKGNSGNAPGKNKDKDENDGGGDDEEGGTQYGTVLVGVLEDPNLRNPKFNNARHLIANYRDPEGVQRAIYSDDLQTYLEMPSFYASSWTHVNWLNNVHQAVGGEFFWNAESNDFDDPIAVLWDTSVDDPIALPMPEGAVASIAEGINDDGHIWGLFRYETDERLVARPALWLLEGVDDEGNGLYNLPIDLGEWIPEDARRPQIIGMSDQALTGALLLGGYVGIPRSDHDTWVYQAPCVWKVQLTGDGNVEIEFILLHHDPDKHHYGRAFNALGDLVSEHSDAIGLVWVNEGDGYGEPIDIGHLGLNHWKTHDDLVRPDDMNVLGQVVGRNRYSTNHKGGTTVLTAFIWQDGVMADLNELLPDGYRFDMTSRRLQINDLGDILGMMEDGLWYLAIPEE